MTQLKSASNPLSLLSQSIVKTLLYFDLFDYPLKKEEIFSNLQANHVSEAEVTKELQRLSEAKILFQSGEFFSMQQNDTLVSRRIAGNKKAQEFMRIAARRSSWIYQFPFVRAVMISGSLSKNYADEHTDIDFFIITAPKRLWVARTLLVLFKRVFLFNSHKYFCVNYFIDEEHLEIEEKNLFTATELATLVPMLGAGLYDELMESNSWIREILPHVQKKVLHPDPANNASKWPKKLMEKAFSSGLGHWLDKKFMNLTQLRWKKLYSRKLSSPDFEIAFKSKEYVSKNHVNNFQRAVLDRYHRKLEEFALLHPWKWTHG